MASVTDPIVGGGGSIFAPPPVTPQPVGKLNNASTVGLTASAANNSATATATVDTLSISDLAKSLAAAKKAEKTAAA